MWRWLLAFGLLLSVPCYGETTINVGPESEGGESPSLSFCQLRFYEEENGRLYCNWAVNFRYACFVSYPSDKILQAGSKISEPEVVGECDNGEPIIKLFHY
ncbi:hypothetical protein SAMN04487965_0566 [Microbulbifer donghaiensis]|uniref:Uncharacterized protein n=1 Tax=Microbulbifer donghaiensis TaxID=494016 RepID=A0A1M4W1P8_9GAMM|nr:hypothetical protein [Microbulbifer donghaiensis]SHE74882.1 hypothetical protein SAMN04487965_0566 [Microbulbifer donghaiensis]